MSDVGPPLLRASVGFRLQSLSPTAGCRHVDLPPAFRKPGAAAARSPEHRLAARRFRQVFFVPSALGRLTGCRRAGARLRSAWRASGVRRSFLDFGVLEGKAFPCLQPAGAVLRHPFCGRARNAPAARSGPCGIRRISIFRLVIFSKHHGLPVFLYVMTDHFVEGEKIEEIAETLDILEKECRVCYLCGPYWANECQAWQWLLLQDARAR